MMSVKTYQTTASSGFTRYKGKPGTHLVEIAVPLGGLGDKITAMYDFHSRHGVEPKRNWRRDYGGSYIRWCFADPAIAAAFAKKFDA